MLCEICESNPRSHKQARYCESCRDEFKESEGER